jgi:hypothetical protein
MGFYHPQTLQITNTADIEINNEEIAPFIIERDVFGFEKKMFFECNT